MAKLEDLRGKVFGRLRVLRRVHPEVVMAIWRCRCTCGKYTEVYAGNLKKGLTKSCGCYRKERGIEQGRSTRRHGHTPGGQATPEYKAWRSMRDRCANKHNKSYKNYGARGIQVCEEWRQSFENFLAYMGLRPSKNYSLERLENNGDYMPGNVVWATSFEQNANKRNSRILTLHGDSLIMSEWARRLGVAPSQISARLAKGWPLEKALTQKPRVWTRTA